MRAKPVWTVAQGKKAEAQQLWSPQHPNQNIGNLPNAELASKGIVLNRWTLNQKKNSSVFPAQLAFHGKDSVLWVPVIKK